MAVSSREIFYQVLSAAIDDLMEHGFDSQERLDRWLFQLREAARHALVPEAVLVRALSDSLGMVFRRSTTDRKLLQMHPGISQFTINNIKPALRAELNRRIQASASLITLNRDASIARTLQRFAGWGSSVPIGGTEVAKRKEVKQTIRRGIAALPFEERRVVIDQGHKLVAAINDIVATDGGAISMTWKHVHESSQAYQPRPEHVARDGKVFLIRGSWAHKQGLVKPTHGYTDEIEAPAELPFCRCTGVYGFTLRDLPSSMLTAKGASHLAQARAQLRAVS
jgi:hypothetical protein